MVTRNFDRAFAEKGWELMEEAKDELVEMILTLTNDEIANVISLAQQLLAPQ